MQARSARTNPDPLLPPLGREGTQRLDGHEAYLSTVEGRVVEASSATHRQARPTQQPQSAFPKHHHLRQLHVATLALSVQSPRRPTDLRIRCVDGAPPVVSARGPRPARARHFSSEPRRLPTSPTS
jgi:hypothetical protein